MSELFSREFRLERRSANGISLNVRHSIAAGLPPLLLLHGFPQTHAMWHAVAPLLRAKYSLVLPDLRGYGDSDKPPGTADHSGYSKRAMALDMRELMVGFGFNRFFVCGHDRGGRVAHRLALDHADAVLGLLLLDISPTLTMYERTTMEFARLYYHWFFLIQPAPLPETLIGAAPLFFLRKKLGGWGSGDGEFFDPAALAEYERCFDAAAIHAMCEDYRAAASVDLAHDRADSERRIRCPVRVLWGERGVVHRVCTPIEDWQAKASSTVDGRAVPTGHYIAEEAPTLLAAEIDRLFSARTGDL